RGERVQCSRRYIRITPRTERRWGCHDEAVLLRQSPYRARQQFHAATGRAIRLRQDERNYEAAFGCSVEQRLQWRRSELGRARKNNAHAWPIRRLLLSTCAS